MEFFGLCIKNTPCNQRDKAGSRLIKSGDSRNNLKIPQRSLSIVLIHTKAANQNADYHEHQRLSQRNHLTTKTYLNAYSVYSIFQSNSQPKYINRCFLRHFDNYTLHTRRFLHSKNVKLVFVTCSKKQNKFRKSV